VSCTLPRPGRLAEWEIPPFRDEDRVAKVDRAFERLELLDELRGR
jgi:hypothetical protein